MAIDIFDFLNDVWDLLPESDRQKFGELWKGYEQTYADVWTKLLESNLASSIDFVPRNNNQRWLKHAFDASTEVRRAATYRGVQDLSRGVDLSQRHILRVSINGASAISIDLRSGDLSRTAAKDIVSRINLAVGFPFAVLEENGALIRLTSNIAGPASSIELLAGQEAETDATPVVLGPQTTDLPILLPKFPYSYRLQDRAIVSIPSLQDRIHEEQIESKLTQSVDYVIEPGAGIISFSEQPGGAVYWGKDNLLNLETPYNNFGYLLDIYDSNSESYLKAIRGLWFAFWTGPRPENIRRSLYLLFGLPTASNDGTVVSVSGDSISLRYADGSTETFPVPTGLSAEVFEGEAVSRFQPLVSGIRVYDKLNSPGFLNREIGRAAVSQFLTRGASRGLSASTDESRAIKLLEQNTYLPQIDVNAFVRSDIKLSNVKTFLRNIQPKSRTFLFQILVGTFNDRVSASERVSQLLSLSPNWNLDSNFTLWSSQEDLALSEESPNTGHGLDTESLTARERVQILVTSSLGAQSLEV